MVKKILPLIILLLSICSISYSQNSANLKIDDRFFGRSLHGIFSDLEKKYLLTFDYNKEDIPDRHMVPQFFNNVKLSEVIDKLLESYDVHYIIQNSRNIIIRKTGEELVKSYTPTQFDLTIDGKLFDNKSGETLPFASVYIKSTLKGTTTNVDGYFTLLNVPSDTSTIVVKYIGYRTKEVRLNPELIQSDQLSIKLDAMSTQLQEVVISDKKEHMIKASEGISTISISPKQLSALPSLGEKDIFRSLQMLPGISATNETSSGLYVRGGTPDQNLVLFDGFTVYHVDHFYGFFSAFNANAVKDVQLYKGGFDAKYGGRISSVVSLTGKDGNTNRVSGNFGISALSTNASFEAPFANGKGSIFFSGRRSYTDIIRSGLYNNLFDLFQEENTDEQSTSTRGPRFAQTETEPSFFFYDLNTKVSYRPTNKDIISFSIYNGKDKLDNSSDFDSSQSQRGGLAGNASFDNSTTDLNDWGNVGTSIKWGKQWSNRFYSNNTLSYSKYFSNRDRYSSTEITRDDSTFNIKNGTLEDNDVIDYTFRSDYEYLLNEKHKVEFGTQMTYNEIDYNQIQNDTVTILDRRDQGLVLAGYIQDTWNITDRWSITPGLRLSHYSETGTFYHEPRFSTQYQLTDKLKVKAAYGQYNQFVTRVVREDVSQGSRDFWLLANEDLNPVSSATHYIAGLSYETNGFLFDVEGYYKNMAGLSEYTLRFSNDRRSTTAVDELFYEGTGYSKGIEFLAQKKFGKYTGWLGYTLSEVIHDFPELSDIPFPALHDQTHEFKSVNSFRLGSWTLSGTWVYATGKPYTSPNGGYEVSLLDGATNSYVSIGEKNGYRLPNYHRLDISATYGWDWGVSGTKAELGLSIFNLYNNENTWYKTFEVIEDDIVATDVNTIGLTPNIFFNIKF